MERRRLPLSTHERLWLCNWLGALLLLEWTWRADSSGSRRIAEALVRQALGGRDPAPQLGFSTLWRATVGFSRLDLVPPAKADSHWPRRAAGDVETVGCRL